MNATGFKPEIQGLRAIAVLLVLLFHIWPSSLTGGYVGVDVFFVISGYLITGILLREAESTQKVRILDFYARRIRRLLPAATLVLVAVATCVSILPLTRWEGLAHELIASALYVENWWLAHNAIDYMAQDGAPSPLQHYWTLSVEEQYYIIWPIIIGTAFMFPAARRRPRATFGVLVATIALASLLHSIELTSRSPGFSYFATSTRAWELAIGGALAVFTGWSRLPGTLRTLMGYVGVAGIIWAAWSFDGELAFPGYHALLPTFGAAFVIIAGSAAWSPYALLRTRPLQYFGDISYSLYLWHWPVIIFYGELIGRDIELIDGVIIAGVSTALAHQSKQLVEDSFRREGFVTSRSWMPFALAGICIAWVIWSTVFISYQYRVQISTNTEVEIDNGGYPGAMALYAGIGFDPDIPYKPRPELAVKDQALAYRDRCIANALDVDVRECRYGVRTAKKHMVLVGDSHAVHWIPALDDIAKRQGWRLTVITKSACPVGRFEFEHRTTDQARSCLDWNEAVIRRVLGYRAEVVVFAHSWGSLTSILGDRLEGVEWVSKGIEKFWKELEHNGSRVVAIRDTPGMDVNPPDCMARSSATVESCSRPRVDAVRRHDPLVMAAARHPSVLLVDMTDEICGELRCDPVVGNVFVWRDTHHLTASYAHSLAAPLEDKLSSVLDSDRDHRD